MQLYKSAFAALAMGTIALGGCSGADSKSETSSPTGKSGRGELGMALTLPDDSTVDLVNYTITGPGGFVRSGTVPTNNSSKLRFRIGNLPIQNGYNIALGATTGFNEPCSGNVDFNITSADFTTATVLLICQATDNENDLVLNGEFQSCPLVTTLQAIPSEAYVGATMAFTAGISHGDSTVTWSAVDGTFAPATGYDTTYTCTSVGVKTVTATITGLAPECNDTLTMEIECSQSVGCGNGVVQGTEQCDDGNTDNTDDCTNNCFTAVCGDGIVRTGANAEACDDGNGDNTDTCNTSCLPIACGDGVLNPATEDCDDGNTVNTDACPNSCENPGCGDGIVQAPEECDDDNTSNTDGCTNACLLPACGDGFVQGTEQCDDGNTASGDACESDCTQPALTDIPQKIAACASCRQANCTDYNALNAVASCFTLSATVTPADIQLCVDLRDCIYTENNGYTVAGAITSYCGTADPGSTCSTAGAANGPCKAEWEAAIGSTVPNDILGGSGDDTNPAGAALYLTQCDADLCAPCRPL